MPRFDPSRCRAILARHPGYAGLQHFVETGTYYGERALMAATLFAQVDTIELSAPLYERAKANLAHLPVTCHLGDSRVVLPRLAAEIAGPCVFYLDAHWFKQPDVAGEAEGLPLWDELWALQRRPPGDVVIVDDARDFGGVLPTPEWKDVTLLTIAAALTPYREAIVLFRDQAVIYR